jgi:hypothetical protein
MLGTTVKNGTCILMSQFQQTQRKLFKREAGMILKYKDCTTETERIWTVDTKVIPVTTGATGTISKSLGEYLSNVPGKHEIKELQKIAILGTAHC